MRKPRDRTEDLMIAALVVVNLALVVLTVLQIPGVLT